MSGVTTTTIDICDANRKVSMEVKAFMEHVSEIKEETITDYLVWKWREIDKRFNYLRVTAHDHHIESKVTGADFDLELWLVGTTHHISLAIQAKKFIGQYGSYVNHLRYPNGTATQLSTLLNYAASSGRRPFYLIYTIPDNATETRCGNGEAFSSGIFMVDAQKIKEFADGKFGKRVSRNRIVGEGNPFHCIFCCLLGGLEAYFGSYFAGTEAQQTRTNNELPDYVQNLLSKQTTESVRTGAISEAGGEGNLNHCRYVGVYDLGANSDTDGKLIPIFRR
jgi:hypothetical protein